MEISLALILSRLDMDVDLYINGSSPSFRTVELYTEESIPQEGTLVVCPLSEALSAVKRPGIYYICVRDRMPDEHESPDSLENTIVVKRNIGFRKLFNSIQNTFREISDWVMAMERSTAAHEGMQALLRLAEPIFHNFITIQDGTFKLLAYTKNIAPPDNVMRRLVQYGYHPPETMELFRKYRRIEQYQTSTDIIVDRDQLTSEYDIVKKTLHTGDSIYILVVMSCSGHPADEGTVELFRLLTYYIKRLADSEMANTNSNSSGIRKLAVDIITGNISNEEEARVRSTYCGFNFEKSLRLYIISFQDRINTPLEHVARKLADALSGCVTLLLENRILLLKEERMKAETFHSMLREALEPMSYACGISDNFDSIWKLSAAYDQAVIAIDIASQLHASPGGEDKFYYFSDTYIYKVILSGIGSSQRLFESSLLHQSLLQLKKYDESHGTCILSIMRAFLENERRATKVAELMHLHRNTILHHVERGEKLLGISLENPTTRLQLLMAFRASDFEDIFNTQT